MRTIKRHRVIELRRLFTSIETAIWHDGMSIEKTFAAPAGVSLPLTADLMRSGADGRRREIGETTVFGRMKSNPQRSEWA